MIKKTILGVLLALAATQAANAAVTTINGSFQASGWQVYFGSPAAPIDPLFMNYSATFDDALIYNNDPSVLTINSTNVPYPVNFSFNGSLMILASVGNSSSCTHFPSTFCAFIPASTGVPTFVEQSPADGGGWSASQITGTAQIGVPEPATWALLIGGFGLTGAALRRRRTAIAA